jgi:hypothetical protein
LPGEGYFDSVAMEPDFVDKDQKEGSTDDEEVAKLSRVQGFGLGTLVDRLVGWPLFNVDEDTEDETPEEEGEAGGNPEELLRKKEAQLQRRKEQLAKAASSSASATIQRATGQRQQQAEEGGWQDAAWLLSVASKVLL